MFHHRPASPHSSPSPSPPSGPASRPELLALLGAIREAPDDPTPRLILADWLEEFGRPADRARAELIRLYLGTLRDESARVGRGVQSRQMHGGDWLGPLATRVRWVGHGKWLDTVLLEPGVLLSRAVAETQGTEPWAWIGALQLRGADGNLAPRLAASPLLAGLLAVAFPHGTLGTLGVRALVCSPHLGSLRHLELVNNVLDPASVTALVQAHSLPRLSSLDLSGNRLGAAGVEALAHSTPLSRLTSLEMAHCEIPAGGVVALARSPESASLRQLNLADNRLGPGDARALVDSPHLANLESLVLWGNPLAPAAAQGLRERFGDRVSVA